MFSSLKFTYTLPLITEELNVCDHSIQLEVQFDNSNSIPLITEEMNVCDLSIQLEVQFDSSNEEISLRILQMIANANSVRFIWLM